MENVVLGFDFYDLVGSEGMGKDDLMCQKDTGSFIDKNGSFMSTIESLGMLTPMPKNANLCLKVPKNANSNGSFIDNFEHEQTFLGVFLEVHYAIQ